MHTDRHRYNQEEKNLCAKLVQIYALPGRVLFSSSVVVSFQCPGVGVGLAPAQMGDREGSPLLLEKMPVVQVNPHDRLSGLEVMEYRA